MTQVLIPVPAYERVADRLVSLPHQIEPLLWSTGGVVDNDGQPVEKPAPEAAWMSIDAFFTGDMMDACAIHRQPLDRSAGSKHH